MAEATFVQDGIERVQTAVNEIDKRYRKLQKQAEKRRKTFERDAERRIKRIQTDLRKNTYVKRAQSLRGDAIKRAQGLRGGATKRIEEQVEQVLSTFRIASQADVERLDRKVAQLTRKLRELERSQDAA